MSRCSLLEKTLVAARFQTCQSSTVSFYQKTMKRRGSGGNPAVPWSSLAALACAESSSTKHNVCNHNTWVHAIQSKCMQDQCLWKLHVGVLNFGAAFSAACNQRATATLAHPAASSTTPEQHPRTVSSLQPVIRTKQRAY